eukprot:3799637-Rhodomonas_salina.1
MPCGVLAGGRGVGRWRVHVGSGALTEGGGKQRRARQPTSPTTLAASTSQVSPLTLPNCQTPQDTTQPFPSRTAPR